ncbi:hypothetical protein V8E36_005302 [Tilletia maclaganii]
MLAELISSRASEISELIAQSSVATPSSPFSRIASEWASVHEMDGVLGDSNKDVIIRPAAKPEKGPSGTSASASSFGAQLSIVRYSLNHDRSSLEAVGRRKFDMHVSYDTVPFQDRSAGDNTQRRRRAKEQGPGSALPACAPWIVRYGRNEYDRVQEQPTCVLCSLISSKAHSTSSWCLALSDQARDSFSVPWYTGPHIAEHPAAPVSSEQPDPQLPMESVEQQ